MKQLNTQLHTIFMLVGPTGCGKSTFAEKVLIPKLFSQFEGQRIHIPLISSDNLRRELIGPWFGKHEDEMLYCSDQAFKLLFTKLELATSFPVNSPFVVVDTTGLSKEFRQDVARLARKNQYALEVIVFSYNDREEYTKYLDDSYDMKIVFAQLKRLNQETYKELNRRDFNNIHKIKSKDFMDYEVVVQDIGQYKRNLLDPAVEYTIVGDIHGCLEEFKSLLIKNKFVIEEDVIKDNPRRKIIQVGDLIDKGPNSKGVLDFVYKNINQFKIVLGNHENFVYKFFKKQIKENSVPEEIITNFFNTTKEFLNDQDAIEKLNYIVENSHPFVRGRNFIVTHAPCEMKYLGKLDRESRKAQRKFDSPKREDFLTEDLFIAEYEKQLAFLKSEAISNFPYHVFGHDAFSKPLVIKNKIGLDTNCSGGGKLTSVVINHRTSKFFESVPSINAVEVKERVNLFSASRVELSYVDLSPQELNRVHSILRNKVNFISGTMCPAEKDMEKMDIESMDNALSYYKERGIKEVILQTKYMGSRCNVYLFKDLEKCYATSRNGYLVRGVEMAPIYQKLLDRFNEKMDKENIQLLIIDGELMPWYALGKGLIETEYRVVEKALKSELDLLEQSGFESNLFAIKHKMDSTDFAREVNTVSKQEMVEKYTHAAYSTFKGFLDYSSKHISLSEQQKLWEVYSEQLKIFGSESELHYKPFALLKTVYEDGSEKLHFDETNEEVYKSVNDDPYLLLNLEDPEASFKANAYYNDLTVNKNLEGVVVKPNDKVFIRGVAPYRKIRNKKYLTIIYGYDYTHPYKYEKLLRQKSIGKKLSLSIKEFELGKKMLEVPWVDIAEGNKTYFNLVAKMISEEKNAKGIDPRL